VSDPVARQCDLAGEVIDEIVHGTTVATNTILDYTGARTALLTTAGFRDVLESLCPARGPTSASSRHQQAMLRQRSYVLRLISWACING
jgi:N-methylhydantoinase A/oxoprolinase/acetone carboxylase beta subunit